MEGHWKFLGDGGSHKPKMFKGKCEAELEFPEGWKGRGGGPSNQKKPSWGSWIFSGTTQCTVCY